MIYYVIMVVVQIKEEKNYPERTVLYSTLQFTCNCGPRKSFSASSFAAKSDRNNGAFSSLIVLNLDFNATPPVAKEDLK